jgi:ATP phosphoribosyltransferase regulatory subunit HisZ
MSRNASFSVVADDVSSDAALGGAFDGVLEAYRQEGYEAGYRRAVNDLLADFPLISADFIRSQSAPSPELRKVLRAFEEHLERAAGASANSHHFVDGGLGI